jgi:AcrR family transcriptional regulator
MVTIITSQEVSPQKREETVAKPEKPTPRREALLAAAAEVFFEQGYAATSIDAIIARAGGSKRNIYNEFGNKEGLFLAIVEDRMNQVPAFAIEETGGRDLHETLMMAGHDLMALYMSPTLIGIYRIAITEAYRFPSLAKSFYEKGPTRTVRWLAKMLEGAKTRGDIRAGDCASMASHFIAMIRDNLHLQVVLGLRSPPSAKEANASVASVVDILLNGIGSGRRI